MGEVQKLSGWLVKNLKEAARGPPTHKWEDNTKVNLKEIMCEDVNWIKLAHKMGPSGM